MKLLANSKLTYFGIPGRGETIRLALSIGGVPFEDERIAFSDWGTVKPKTPWGSLPMITLSDGRVVAQQRALLRMVGAETGLYPKDDSYKAALIDSLLDFIEDTNIKVNALGQGLPKEEKEAARLAGVSKDGAVHNMMLKIESFIGENGNNGYSVGDSLSIADLAVFCSVGGAASGFFDGIPPNAFDVPEFSNISAVRKSVRTQESVQKWYEQCTAKSISMAPSFGPF